MRISFIVLIGVFFLPLLVLASLPVEVAPASVDDTVSIVDPELVQQYYGSLDDFPHTYTFSSDTPFRLVARISVPDIAVSQNNISAIIIKDTLTSGVEEVARLSPGQGSWEAVRDWETNDWYRVGPSFDQELSSGTYRLEISTPENIEKYMIVIGFQEDDTHVGYVDRVKHVAKTKEFFGKSELLVIESPYIFSPLIVLFLTTVIFMLPRRRR